MNLKTFSTLEFNKIRDILNKYSVTYLGKSKIEELVPSNDIEIVKLWQSETTEASNIILRKGTPPLCPINENIGNILTKVNIGGLLNQLELLELARLLKLSRELKSYYFSEDFDKSSYQIISIYFDSLYSNLNVESEIFRCIKSETEIDDHASPALYSIRRKILDSESRIKEKLNNIIHSSNTSKYLQDSVVTFRNGRYVVPVKQEYKSEVPGLVHDASSSGSTIFIEPSSVFNLNNEIKELKIQENAEIEKILYTLTQLFLPIYNEVYNNLIQIQSIDFSFAKAKYSLEISGFEPKLNENGYINLKHAKHPLISRDKVVPIDIWLGKEFNCLIITGPNTGGKTVSLKTVGLLCLMSASGLHIPASENSEVAIFSDIYTDIGDEQSIEQSLSTFSSHITNIINIVKSATSKDLILLDELGAGTDPVEGAALAMSILSFFHDLQCRIIATTHYSELKTFAIQTIGIENASCEFDVATLSPTYKLLIGVPGTSNAFAISQKLGLNPQILEQAKTYLTSENIKLEDLLGDIEKNQRLAKEEREASKKILLEAQELENKSKKMEKEILDKKNEVISKAKQEAKDILLSAQDEANKIIKELTSLKNSKNSTIYKEAELKRKELKDSINELQDTLPISSSGKILLGSFNTTKEEKLSSNLVSSKSKEISSEINLLGYTVDEAIYEIDKYLDDAFLSKMGTVRIVHGKGSGALKNGIHKYLKTNKHVKSFRLGMYGEGDNGVTVVELR